MFPTAPVQPYTPLNGENSNVWFDRKAVNIIAQESRRSMASIYETVGEIIRREINLGVKPERIIVGGFSMGGALALHVAFHLRHDLGGVFACSSFLNRDSVVYDSLKTLKTDCHLPKLLQFHGDRDSLVPISWGKETFEKLIAHGVKGEFVPLKNTMHELKTNEIIQLVEWINASLPPLETDLANKL